MLSGEIALASVRTVVLRRSLKGATADYFTFDARASAVNFVEAAGTSADFMYHGVSRGGVILFLIEAGGAYTQHATHQTQ